MKSKSRMEQAEVARIIGRQLRAARELCNLSATEAARRLGYTNASGLVKIELAKEGYAVPLSLIVQAAKYYEVSIDYLFGLTTDWDTGSRMTRERATSAWLFETWQKQHQHDMDVLKLLHDKFQFIEQAAVTMVEATRQIQFALESFAELHPEFHEMRCSRLVANIHHAVDAAQSIGCQLKRFHIECVVASHDMRQLSLQFL
ncbi:helix-turn-helix domain-containing protein [Neisseriaceae bacterium TC5R-5]|nr:helix-turn-helix domain-containing protein [Neisseriaceae bacterium TC5R-5]